jgi:hypothetical protein
MCLTVLLAVSVAFVLTATIALSFRLTVLYITKVIVLVQDELAQDVLAQDELAQDVLVQDE